MASESKKKLHKEILKQMIALSTAGFGLVAALAWNNFIQEVVTDYIKPYLPASAGVISLALYAIIITIFAVFVTFQLSTILDKLD